MNYAGYKSNYAAGDYYRRPYAAGGLFGFLGKAIGAVGGILPGPIGAVAKAAGGILAPKKAPGMALIPAPSMVPMQIPVPRGAPGAQPVPGIGGTVQRFLPGGASGYQSPGQVPSGYHLNKSYSYARGLPAGSFLVRNRSLNPGNASAIRRAARRQQSFLSLSRHVARNLGYKVVRAGTAKGGKKARR
jgi:hypothetical protein